MRDLFFWRRKTTETDDDDGEPRRRQRVLDRGADARANACRWDCSSRRRFASWTRTGLTRCCRCAARSSSAAQGRAPTRWPSWRCPWRMRSLRPEHPRIPQGAPGAARADDPRDEDAARAPCQRDAGLNRDWASTIARRTDARRARSVDLIANHARACWNSAKSRMSSPLRVPDAQARGREGGAHPASDRGDGPQPRASAATPRSQRACARVLIRGCVGFHAYWSPSSRARPPRAWCARG